MSPAPGGAGLCGDGWKLTVAELCRDVAHSKERSSDERLEKSDNCLNHFVSREQLMIIVIGVRKDEQRLRIHGRIVQSPTVLNGHDSITPTGNDEQWRSDPVNLIGGREPVAQKKTHRQKRVVMLSH